MSGRTDLIVYNTILLKVVATRENINDVSVLKNISKAVAQIPVTLLENVVYLEFFTMKYTVHLYYTLKFNQFKRKIN